MRTSLVPLAALLLAPHARAAPADAPGLDLFERKVRPLLVQHCYPCHSAKKQRGGLALDTRDGLRKGGDRGAALVPGKPDESLLVRAVRHADTGLAMPPKGKLPPAALADLAEWVRLGAPDPRTGATQPSQSGAAGGRSSPCAGPPCPTRPAPPGRAARSIASFSRAWSARGCARRRPPTAARWPAD